MNTERSKQFGNPSRPRFVRRVASQNTINRILKIAPTAPEQVILPVIEPVVELIAIDPVKPADPIVPESEEQEVEQAPVSAEVAEPVGTSIDLLDIPSAYKKALQNNGIDTIEQLQQFVESGQDLVALKEIGNKSAAKIKEGLEQWLSELKKTQL